MLALPVSVFPHPSRLVSADRRCRVRFRYTILAAGEKPRTRGAIGVKRLAAFGRAIRAIRSVGDFRGARRGEMRYFG
ncbi:hypothetical protein JCM17478_29910 [Thermopirellula anaerolimosa]